MSTGYLWPLSFTLFAFSKCLIEQTYFNQEIIFVSIWYLSSSNVNHKNVFHFFPRIQQQVMIIWKMMKYLFQMGEQSQGIVISFLKVICDMTAFNG